jgi:nucleotide-binding universal stress UspA family protein
MKRVLAAASDNPTAVYATALLVARRFEGRVVGLGARSVETVVIPWGEMGGSVPVEADRLLERESEERRRQARQAFESFMSAERVPTGSPPEGHKGPSAEWREEDGPQNTVVGSLGRVFDLIVVERPTRLTSLAEVTLEDALFESGRPVLMAPDKPGTTIGETVLIAWNGSTESARSVALATPFLKRAKRVEVVSIESGMTPGPSSEELARGIAAHGIPAIARHVTAKGRTPGEAFLDEAKAIGADLMIKGAYTQSRLRQMIFGGATRHIINAAEIPVLFAH